MGKVIQLDKHRKVDRETILLVNVADAVDTIVMNAIKNEGLDPRDLAGVLAHRLGTLIRHLENKERLFEVCTDVARGQAAVDE